MQLSEFIDRLATFEPSPFPVVSLYLDMQPDEHGRDRFDAFLRREVRDRLRTFPASSPERRSLEADFERIGAYLNREVQPSANGLAIFASSGTDGFFEAMQFPTSPGDHRLYIEDRPQLYPLVRMLDQHPRYAVLLADTHQARIFVVGLATLEREERVENVKTKKTAQGGWSQARFQRHISNYHQQHVKEVVEVLDRIVREEGIDQVIVAGDEVVIPLLRAEMPKALASKVVDVMRLDVRTPEHEVVTATLERMRQKDAKTDEARVARLFAEYRSGGLGVIGAEDTRRALELGQVDELIIAAHADGQPQTEPGSPQEEAARRKAGKVPPDLDRREAEDLVTRARQTGAEVTFIEDAVLLREAGGVGALLRFRL